MFLFLNLSALQTQQKLSARVPIGHTRAPMKVFAPPWAPPRDTIPLTPVRFAAHYGWCNLFRFLEQNCSCNYKKMKGCGRGELGGWERTQKGRSNDAKIIGVGGIRRELWVFRDLLFDH